MKSLFRIKLIYYFIFLFFISSCSTTKPITPIFTTISDPQRFSEVFHNSEFHQSEHRNKIQIQGLVGRVLKGKTSSDFEKLSDNPDRKLIFLMGEDGLQSIVGLTQQEILLKIGYTPDYISRLQSEGYKFKLVVFNSTETKALPATWDNVIQFVKELYPSLSNILNSAAIKLKTSSFSEIQKTAPMGFSEVDKLGKDHPYYFDERKLLGSDKKLWQVRSFLYHQARLTELFSGDGYTYANTGVRQLKEYIIVNKPISQLTNAYLIDL